MVRFKMVGRDINSNPTQYRTWVVSGQPDYTAQFYTGLKSGPNALVDIFAVEIDDPTVVADFNLPIPTDWYQIDNQLNVSFPIRKVLPATMESGAFCILDGYAYIFGGKVTNQIFQCNLNNPGDWVATDGYLPTILYGASLAIIDGYIWLFGGNNGNESDLGKGVLDTAYSAPISNPLQWTNNGSVLPRHLQYSNLAITGGQIYLFGGQEINDATNVIFTAPTSNPLAWTDTGARLPNSVYKSAFGQVNGFFMIFGGLLFPDTPSNLIWSAPVAAPTNWSVTGALPYQCALGKFINIGGDGYIFTPTVNPSPSTSFCNILQSNLQVNPNLWFDIQKTIPANLSNSNLAVIYDRIWFFGGSGLTAMFACNQQLKYSFTAPKARNYGFMSRTVLQTTDNVNNPSLALSIPYWVTDYALGTPGPPPPPIVPTLWALSEANPPTLYRLNTTTLAVLNSYSLPGGSGTGLDMVELNGFLWVLCDRAVSKVRPSDGIILSTITLPAPGNFAIASDGVQYLYVSHVGNPTGAYRIDTVALTVSQPIIFTPSANQSAGLAVDPGTGSIFIAGNAFSTNVFVFPTPSYSPQSTISISDGAGTQDPFSVLAAAGSIWVSGDNSTTNVVKRIDPVAQTVIATVNASVADPFAFNITDLKYNSKYNLIYAGYDDSGRIDKIDPLSNLASPVFQGPPGFFVVGIATFGDFLWACEDNTGTVSYYNIPSSTFERTVAIDPAGIVMVAYTT